MGLCDRRCDLGFADCNLLPGDGCEVDTESDVTHCGNCGTHCNMPPPAHGTAGCSSGACMIIACDVGWSDDNGAYADGCEAMAAGCGGLNGSLCMPMPPHPCRAYRCMGDNGVCAPAEPINEMSVCSYGVVINGRCTNGECEPPFDGDAGSDADVSRSEDFDVRVP
jgi:hypothetical protein